MNVDEVSRRLESFKTMLNIETVGNYIVVRGTKWMSPEDFAKITTIIKEFNGERVGGIGKESHWRVPVSHAVEGSQQNILDRLDKDIDILQICLRDLAELKKALKQ